MGYTGSKFSRTAASIISGALALSLLSGCAQLTKLVEGPTPEQPKREKVEKPKTEPRFYPDGSAEDNLPYFQEVLRKYASGDGAVQGQPIVDALVAAGFAKDHMQVSFDQSKTNLPADSIYVSVKIADQCLVGQVVTEDRSITAKAMPALGPELTCLVGKTRPIDW